MCQIKYVSARDAGTYECQVSTVPKLSRRVELVVVVPKVRQAVSLLSESRVKLDISR